MSCAISCSETNDPAVAPEAASAAVPQLLLPFQLTEPVSPTHQFLKHQEYIVVPAFHQQ
jgi:hypothetical protein